MELRVLLLLPLCFPGLQAQTPDAKESRSEGSTLYIQCPYTAQDNYQQQKSWWVIREGKYKLLVETTNPTEYPYTTHATKGKVTIEDDPMHRTVSITMTNLQAEDSGTYSCAYYSSQGYLPLKTISLNVFKELRKWELDSLSVQCPYSALGYSTGTKALCRREGQTECKVVVRTDYTSTRRNSKALEDRALIQDDTQNRMVTITMEKLQAQDTGVYWCALHRGSHVTCIMEVKLIVSKILGGATLSGTADTSQSTPPGNSPPPSSNVNTFILLSGVLSILFILALISVITLCVRRHKQLKRKGTRQAEDIYDKPEDIAQPDITERMESPKDDSKDLKYVTLNFKSRLSPEDPLYCNVEPSQTHRKPEDENVEYAIIALK
ncbi:TREM1 protein, partial [Scopus umbretta]|nr:TREM1 protein [Scopus umbretta]